MCEAIYLFVLLECVNASHCSNASNHNIVDKDKAGGQRVSIKEIYFLQFPRQSTRSVKAKVVSQISNASMHGVVCFIHLKLNIKSLAFTYIKPIK